MPEGANPRARLLASRPRISIEPFTFDRAGLAMSTPESSCGTFRRRRIPFALGLLLVVPILTAMMACTELPARRVTPSAEPFLAVQSTTRPRVAVVLSAGSLRGFAHMGVLDVLASNGIQPDLIVGTSAGSIAGALFASGLDLASLRKAAHSVDFDLVSGLLASRLGMGRPPVQAFIDRHVGASRIERFPIRFAAVATDLQSGCLAVFNAGDAATAVQASAAMPGAFAPVPIAGRDYADGGLVSPLPVRVARALGAEHVIAVDVTFDPRESRLDSAVDRLFQTTLVMIKAQARREAREADVLIEPALPPEAEITLANRDALIAAGERAAQAALPRIRAMLDQPPARTHRVSPPAVDHEWCRAKEREQIAHISKGG